MRFSFGKYTKLGSVGNQGSYAVEVTAENLWTKPLSLATFDVFFFGKDNIRIGSGYISLTNVAPGETVKFTVNFATTGGAPASLKLAANSLPKELGPAGPPKTIRITVYSVPAGATLRVDGEEVGVTPKQVAFTVGKHQLQFSMQGYHTGTFPMEIGPDDISGGTVNFELGSLAHDTLEMRDGSTIVGDLESVNPAAVTVRVGGELQSIVRNRVKRILLVERETSPEETVPGK